MGSLATRSMGGLSTSDLWLALIVAAGLVVYLVYALLKVEDL